MPTNLSVRFPAFLTEYSDSYQVNWGDEQVYGRMDPIKTYQGTTRKISVAFDVLSDDIQHARENFLHFSQLTKMMYPVYSEPLKVSGGKGRVLKAPPLMRVGFSNLIYNASDGIAIPGLLGCIDGISFNPNRDAGFFIDTDSNDEIIPKVFNISFNLDVQHEHTIGWNERGEFINENFPYAMNNNLSVRQNNLDGDDDVKVARQESIIV